MLEWWVIALACGLQSAILYEVYRMHRRLRRLSRDNDEAMQTLREIRRQAGWERIARSMGL